LVLALRDAGWGVFLAADHLQCLQAVRSGDVDLVLLCLPVADTADMDLPDVLRRVASCAYLPVVIVAERLAESFCCRFLDSGADEIVTGLAPRGPGRPAPASLAQTVSRIRALLRVKDLFDRLEGAGRHLRQALCQERRAARRLRRDNASLLDLASTDGLTGLSNLRCFRGALDHEFKIARRYGQTLSLLMIDVDRFKRINDECGHPAGDRALRGLARVLRRCVRESDLVARVGGDELAVLLPKAGRDEAIALAQRIRSQARRLLLRAAEHQRPLHDRPAAPGDPIRLTVSIGLATWPADARITSPAELLQAADHALLRAKASRDCVETASLVLTA